MTHSTPVRIDEELYEAARRTARTMSRSTAQQIAHWARIGRELEASPHVSVDRVVEVLRGATSYDGLSDEEQAVVRDRWRELIDARAEALRLDRRFADEVRPWVELDDRGNLVRREPTAGSPADRSAG